MQPKTFFLTHLGLSRNFTKDTTLLDIEFEKLVINLARNNPRDTFITLFANNVHNSSYKKLFPNENVFDLTYLLKGKISARSYPGNKEQWDEYYSILPNAVDHVDSFIFYAGLAGVRNAMYYWPHQTADRYSKCLYIFANKVAPQVLLTHKFPNANIIFLMNDARSKKSFPLELQRQPTAIIAQARINLSYKISTTEKIPKLVNVATEYFPIEKMRLLDTPKIEKPVGRKGFGVILNEGDEKHNKARPRLPILREWLLSSTEEFEIYGKWSQDVINSDKRMKGRISYTSVQEKLKSWKYSICIGIDEGWVTGKYVELIENGVVPFLHPSYDSNRLINFPEILRLTEPNQLWERIKELEEDEQKYKQLWDNLLVLINDEDWRTGKIINEKIYSYFDEPYEFKHQKPTAQNWADYFVRS